MTYSKNGMVERACIDLHFARTELVVLSGRASLVRALDHVRQAEESLIIAIAKSNVPPEGGGQGDPPERLKQARPAEHAQDNGSTSRQLLN